MARCPIVFTIDENYVETMLVALTSLVIDGGVNSENAEVHVVHSELGRSAQDRCVRAAAALEVELRFAQLDSVSAAYPVSDWFTPAAYLRLRIAEALPDFDRALYLDCDLVAVGDVRELLSLRPGATLAAVRDLSHPLVGCGDTIPGYADLGIPAEREYFNAGVLVVDLQRWRDEAVAERAARFLVDSAQHVRLLDQDALNVILADRWQRLQGEFNVIVMSHLMPLLEGHYLGEGVLPLADALAMQARARVLHFAGPYKPWHPEYPDCEARRVYDRYRRELRVIEA